MITIHPTAKSDDLPRLTTQAKKEIMSFLHRAERGETPFDDIKAVESLDSGYFRWKPVHKQYRVVYAVKGNGDILLVSVRGREDVYRTENLLARVYGIRL